MDHTNKTFDSLLEKYDRHFNAKLMVCPLFETMSSLYSSPVYSSIYTPYTLETEPGPKKGQRVKLEADFLQPKVKCHSTVLSSNYLNQECYDIPTVLVESKVLFARYCTNCGRINLAIFDAGPIPHDKILYSTKFFKLVQGDFCVATVNVFKTDPVNKV